MKKLIITTLLLISTLANAKSFLVYEQKLYYASQEEVETFIKVIPEVERTYVNTKTDDSGWGFPVKIPGMYYDSETKEVLISIENEIIKCADYKKRIPLFRPRGKVIMTEKCRFKQEVIDEDTLRVHFIIDDK